MKTKLLILLPLFLIGCCISCGSKELTNKKDGTPSNPETISGSFYTTEEVPPPPPPPPASIDVSKSSLAHIENADITTIQKKIIKTADIRMQLQKYSQSKIKLAEIIKKWGADKVVENEVNTESGLTNTIVLRINCIKFDDFVNELVSIASVLDRKNITTNDVTEEFVDIQTRLKNKKLVEERYCEILKQAKTVSEIIEVENYLRVIREEIEAKEARLKYLNNQVDMSTVNIEIYQNYKQIYRSFWGQLLDGMEGGWRGFLYFVIGLFSLWPLWLVLSAIIFLIIRLRRKRKTISK